MPENDAYNWLEFVKSLRISLTFRPFCWLWGIGCNEWITYLDAGPVGINIHYEF